MKFSDSRYEAIIELAKEAGALQKKFFRSGSLDINTKTSEVDLVTEVDIACDKLIVDRIMKLFPEDHVLSEEQGYAENANIQAAHTWIIDPLDGTTNYSVGHPIFAVSIARWLEEEPVFGVVYVPMLDELFVAEKDKGAYGNGKRLKASNRSPLRESVIATGFPYDRATAANNNSENVALMISKVKGIRRLGAAAYDLCLVAAGVYDAYWELRLSKWDLAAGMLMITEAGGYYEHLEQQGKYNVVTGSEELCMQMKDLLNLTNMSQNGS